MSIFMNLSICNIYTNIPLRTHDARPKLKQAPTLTYLAWFRDQQSLLGLLELVQKPSSGNCYSGKWQCK